jgi:hypothetical protein
MKTRNRRFTLIFIGIETDSPPKIGYPIRVSWFPAVLSENVGYRYFPPVEYNQFLSHFSQSNTNFITPLLSHALSNKNYNV